MNEPDPVVLGLTAICVILLAIAYVLGIVAVIGIAWEALT